MSLNLVAIADELRRLQRDGVNRVFVQDDTMRLIAPPAHTSKIALSPGLPVPDATPETEDSGASRASNIDANRAPSRAPSRAPNTINAKETTTVPPFPPAAQIEIPEGDAVAQLTWLRERLLACEVCQAQLDHNTKLVFGTGAPQANILFCGDAPGSEDSATGQVFMGEAGQLLDKIIAAMGLSRESVYLTNILKWRPKHNKPYGNRPPTIEEMRFCLPYIQAQIEIIQPKVIVALGSTTLTGLLGTDPARKMGKVRGTWASFQEIPLMITFHPSYLLRNDTLKTKRMAWEDMLKVMEKCEFEVSEKQRNFFLPKS